MFNIKNFIMSTLKEMNGHYPDFQIKEYALNWYAKGKLNEDDLAEIELLLHPPVEDIVEDVVEDFEEPELPLEPTEEEIVEEPEQFLE